MRSLTALVVLCLTGCAAPLQTDRLPAKSGALSWRRMQGTITGDALVSWPGEQGIRLSFTKPGTPPLLVMNSSSPHEIRIHGPLAGRSWSGSPDKIPPRLEVWGNLAAYLRESPRNGAVVSSGESIRVIFQSPDR